MKKLTDRKSCKHGVFVLVLCLLLAIYCPANAQTLVVPPPPGDLSSVEHLKQSGDYVVEVRKTGDANYTPCFVYRTDNYFRNNPDKYIARPQTSASFTNFSFAGTSVDVKITSNIPVNTVTIRPLNYNIPFKRNGNVITFTIAAPQKLSVEINDRNNPLFIFGNEPDVPNTAATYYYGPGVHHVGKYKTIKSGESVYIAGGAVVEGSFDIASGAQNVSIKGRGVISNGEWEFTPSHGYADMQMQSTIRNKNSNNTVIEGITIANSTGWTLHMECYDYGIANAQFRNIKIINWNMATDGIWFDGKDNVADNCFIFNNDDIFTTHKSINCKISNSIVWGGIWGNLFMHAGWSNSDGITFENIVALGKDGGRQFIKVHNGASKNVNINNITFRNITIEEFGAETVKLIDMDPTNQNVNNWLFDNVTVGTKNPVMGVLKGAPNCSISNISFVNLKMAGSYVTSLSEANMQTIGNVSNVSFHVTEK